MKKSRQRSKCACFAVTPLSNNSLNYPQVEVELRASVFVKKNIIEFDLPVVVASYISSSFRVTLCLSLLLFKVELVDIIDYNGRKEGQTHK